MQSVRLGRGSGWIALCLLCLLSSSVSAQGPGVKKPEDNKPAGQLQANLSVSDEHKVFAQLLEYLYRDTFPPNETPNPDVEPKSSSQVKMFVEQRRKMIGYIRTRLRDLRASPELRELYDDYSTVLDEAEKYGDRLRELEEKYFKGMIRIREDFLRRVQISRLRIAARVIEKNAWAQAYSVGGWWGWGRGWYRRSLWAGTIISAGNIIAGDLRFQARVIELFGEAQKQMDAYQERNLPALFNDMRSEERRFISSLETTRPKLISKGSKSIDALIAQFGWKATEVTLRPFDDFKSENPFVPLSNLNRMENVKTIKQSDECEQAASDLLKLVEKLPTGNPRDSSQVYNRIRADVAFMACMHANRAAEYQLGGDAFSACVKSPTTAGKVAVEAIKLYSQACIGMDVRPRPKAEERYQESLAWAYSGQAQKAARVINEILPQDLGGMNDPKFYFDSARLRCLGDNDGVKLGLKYLSMAFMLGYKNAEKARVAPELELLRKVDPQTFDRVIALNKDKAQ